MQIYIQHNGQQLGPFTEAEFRAKLASGEISAQDHVWYQGMANWMPVAQSPLAGPTVLGAPLIPNVPLPVAPTAKYAVPALVCGCLCLVCGILTAIPAIVLGHMGLYEIKKNPALKGRGMAIAGLSIGYVMLILPIIAIAVLMALGNQVKDTFKTIEAQENSTEVQTTPDSTTTNSPDQNATAPATMTTPATTPDQSTTNSDTPTTNSPDQNAMPATPAATPSTTPSDSSTTNAAPATVTP